MEMSVSVKVEGDRVVVQHNPEPKKHIVVCGAGIIGITTCYFLSQKGHKVTCIDREAKVARITSYQNGGFLEPALFQSWASPVLVVKALKSAFRKNNAEAVKISPWVMFDWTFWYWGAHFAFNCLPWRSLENGTKLRLLGFHSLEKLREAQALHGERLQMRENAIGTLEVFGFDSDELEMEAEGVRITDVRRQHGVDVQVLNQMQTLIKEPTLRSEAVKAGSIFCPSGTNGDVYMMANNLFQICKEQGVDFRFETEIDQIVTEGNKVTGIQTKTGEIISGDDYVIAMGNDTHNIVRKVGVWIPMQPVKGYIISVPTNEDAPNVIARNIYAGGHALVSPLKGVARISGCGEFEGHNYDINIDSVKWLLGQAEKLIQPYALLWEKASYHVCLRPVSGDDVPIIGKTKYQNLYLNTGHGSKGWTLCFGGASLLANAISGEKSKLDINMFSPLRFSLFHRGQLKHMPDIED